MEFPILCHLNDMLHGLQLFVKISSGAVDEARRVVNSWTIHYFGQMGVLEHTLSVQHGKAEDAKSLSQVSRILYCLA